MSTASRGRSPTRCSMQGSNLFVMACEPASRAGGATPPGHVQVGGAVGTDAARLHGHHYTMFDQLLGAWDDSVERMAEGWELLAQRLRDLAYPLPFAYLSSTCSPILWDNAPPNPFLPDLIRRWNETERGPRVRYATFDDLRERALGIRMTSSRCCAGTGRTTGASATEAHPWQLRSTSARRRSSTPASGLGAATGALERATASIDLYDEHTFGYLDTRRRASPDADDRDPEAGGRSRGTRARDLRLPWMPSRGSREIRSRTRAYEASFSATPGAHPITVYPELPEAWFPSNGRRRALRRAELSTMPDDARGRVRRRADIPSEPHGLRRAAAVGRLGKRRIAGVRAGEPAAVLMAFGAARGTPCPTEVGTHPPRGRRRGFATRVETAP